MRITTKVIQNNTLSNININKALQDKLSNQMSTEKKINRPSEDPVVAIRALRLRTNVSEVTQYYEKNIPDAKSWMKVTEDALTNVSEVVTDMIEQCTKGSSEKLTSSDRQIILDALKSLRDEVYATGNADYAGRYVFTGYRTDTPLKYTEATTQPYTITEQLENTAVDSIKYIDTAGLNDLNDVNFNQAPANAIEEKNVQEHDIYRLRLAYGNVDPANPPVISLYNPLSGDYDDDINVEVKSKNLTGTDNPYYIAANDTSFDDKVILVPETGELLLGKNIYSKLMDLKDVSITSTINEGEIRIKYDKKEWAKDDLRPEHYFACTDNTDPTSPINYNSDYLEGSDREKQAVEYDVGMNQSIRVNTTADEIFSHSIGRDVDDLITSLQDVVEMEEKISQLEALAVKYKDDDTSTEYINNQLDSANKALVLLKEKNQKLFEAGITKMQGHLNDVNYATTACGTREKKLELIENRLMSQKTSFETLQSENENVDLTDVAIQLSGAQVTYNAALMATSKILQSSLANYL